MNYFIQPTEIHMTYLFLKYLQIALCKKVAKLSANITEQQEHAITYFVIENEDNYNVFSLAEKQIVTLDMNALLKDVSSYN